MNCNCSNSGAAKKAIGYHLREDGMWTHALCDRPTRLYLEGFIARMAEQVLTHINLLQGGPLHNVFLSNSDLIDRTAIQLKENGDEILKHVDRYRWTPDTLTGGSGKVARIWTYKGD